MAELALHLIAELCKALTIAVWNKDRIITEASIAMDFRIDTTFATAVVMRDVTFVINHT